jgi:hypothetical protein
MPGPGCCGSLEILENAFLTGLCNSVGVQIAGTDQNISTASSGRITSECAAWQWLGNSSRSYRPFSPPGLFIFLMLTLNSTTKRLDSSNDSTALFAPLRPKHVLNTYIGPPRRLLYAWRAYISSDTPLICVFTSSVLY